MIELALTHGELTVWLARQFIGVREFGSNAGPIVERFQKAVDGKAQGEPWCLSYVQYVVREISQLTKANSQLYPTESTQVLWAKTPKHCVAPLGAGVVVVWRTQRNATLGHCGLVVGSEGEDVLTIEGNTGAGDQREGDVVALKRRVKGQIPGMTLLGYLDPFARPK